MNVPQNIPFIAPPATQNGGPVRYSNWQLFCSYGQASEIAALANAAIAKAALTGSVTIRDGIADGEYANNGFLLNVPVNNPPEPSDVSIWLFEGTLQGGNSTYVIDDVLAQIIYRQLFPIGMDQGANGWTPPVGPALGLALAPYAGGPGLAELKWQPTP